MSVAAVHSVFFDLWRTGQANTQRHKGASSWTTFYRGLVKPIRRHGTKTLFELLALYNGGGGGGGGGGGQWLVGSPDEGPVMRKFVWFFFCCWPGQAFGESVEPWWFETPWHLWDVPLTIALDFGNGQLITWTEKRRMELITHALCYRQFLERVLWILTNKNKGR